MPVWHERVKQWIDDESLIFIGLIQEQHPDRCRLFAQWKGFDFPILWDPFNLTDSKVVPNFIAIDEHGIVRSTRPDPRTFEEEFLSVDFEAPPEGGAPGFLAGACCFTELHDHPSPLSALAQRRDVDVSVTALEQLAAANPDDALRVFQAGVAFRLRYDSGDHRPGDFQAAIDHWTRALQLDPNQYIWRRRVQQYGPRMDQPYPFYTWTGEAREEIRGRGGTPVPLVAALTPAELAEPRRAAQPESTEPSEPDERGEIVRDKTGLIGIESAVAFDTSGKRPMASVHLSLRPNAKREAHWNHDVGPTIQVWVDGPEPRLLQGEARSDVETSEEVRVLSFEVEVPPGEEELVVEAYALYYVCEGEAGRCLYLRQDFEVVVRKPFSER